MNQFSEGDLIEATKPKTGERYRARLHRGRISDELVLGQAGNIPRLRKDGFTFEVIEKAAPALPTEPGVYLSKRGLVWELRHLRNPQWYHSGDPVDLQYVAQYGPFTRLEPVADTAKKVAEEFVAQIVNKHDGIRGNTYSIHAATLMEIAGTFGVTS